MIDLLKQELIAIEVIKVLKSRFDSFPDDLTENRNAPFHQAFLNAFSDNLQGKVVSIPFFISLSSWAHGLSTTLGQNFYENVAHILCNGEKKEFNTRSRATLKISPDQRRTVTRIMNELSNARRVPNLEEEDQLLLDDAEIELIDATDFTADIFFEDESEVVCIELKTVKPNKGVFKVEKEKILEAKAGLRNKFATKKIRFFIGFPFDPVNQTATGYDKDRFMRYAVDFRKYIARDEFLLSAELWDFLSGESETMEIILEIINSIATVEFLKEFTFLRDKQNLKNKLKLYIDLLKRWHLNREMQLVENDVQIMTAIQNDPTLARIYNQAVFSDKGSYNSNRLLRLQALI